MESRNGAINQFHHCYYLYMSFRCWGHFCLSPCVSALPTGVACSVLPPPSASSLAGILQNPTKVYTRLQRSQGLGADAGSIAQMDRITKVTWETLIPSLWLGESEWVYPAGQLSAKRESGVSQPKSYATAFVRQNHQVSTQILFFDLNTVLNIYVPFWNL